jgi:GTPase
LTSSKKKQSKRASQGHGVDLASSTFTETRSLVVHVELKKQATKSTSREPADKLAEAIGLTKAIDLSVAEGVIVNLTTKRPSTLIGEGKVEEIKKKIEESEIDVVIVNAQLSPIQQRNLERAWDAKVLDRTGLILEIFGRRAATKEGTMQVELAHLQYQKSRLVRSWTHLERQRGGFGFLGGPGESQIEADRRLIQDRISKIERELGQAVKTRQLHRKGRARTPYPVVAFVGYTNAGKSTLFNRLTSANVLAKDMLFATLDPTMRVISLPKGRKIILSDTVGFISDLPTTLVAAFRATLEEVIEADVILHVRDINHPESDAQAADVDAVLTQLGIDDTRRGHMLEVWNKSDLLDPIELAKRETLLPRNPNCMLVSAIDGSGVADVLSKIEKLLAKGSIVYQVTLAPENGKGLAWLHERGEVLSRNTAKTGKLTLQVRMDDDRAGQAKAMFGRSMRKVKA